MHDAVRLQESLDTSVSWIQSKELLYVPLSERVRDAIELIHLRWHKKTLASGVHGGRDDHGLLRGCDLILDTSQDLRRNAATSSFIRSMCSGSAYYYYNEDRMLAPIEHLGVMGWSYAKVAAVAKRARLSASALRDLAGESMPCPCIALLTSVAALHVRTAWEKA